MAAFAAWMSEVLCGAGLDADSVSEATEATHRVRGGGYDVVVSDIMMPVHDGLTVVSRIRDRNPSIKVVYLSAWIDEADTERRLNEELGNYPNYRLLKKPFDLDTLLQVIAELSSPSAGQAG